MRYVSGRVFLAACVFWVTATGEPDSGQADDALLSKYSFAEWGGTCKTSYSLLHVGLQLPEMLESEYVLVSEYGSEEVAAPIPYTYRRLLIANAPEEDSEGGADAGAKDRPMFNVRYYECRSVLDAHKLLCGTVMQIGSAPSPPNRCLEGVDVGDKCFTGWSKDIPTTIYFVRGNVALSVSSSVSALQVAQKIDAWLSLSPALLQEVTVDESEQETTFLAKQFRGNVGDKILLLKGEADASLRCSITATGGTLTLTEGSRVVLVARKAGEIVLKSYDLGQGVATSRGTATVTIKERVKE